jgi:hypothetical protein
MLRNMKKRKILLLPFFLVMISGCNHQKNCDSAIPEMLKELKAGNLSRVRIMADLVKKSCCNDLSVLNIADSIVQIAERIAIDFSLTDEQVSEQLGKRIRSYSVEDKLEWEEKGWLEYRPIDGNKMFFKRSVSNLILLKKFYEEKEFRQKETSEDPEMVFRLNHTTESIKISGSQSNPVVPVNVGITYTITVHPDVVPDGETIRCWMPWPKANHTRQKKIVLLNTSNQLYRISPDTAIHSTLYMEGKAKNGAPTIFRITYRYESNAQYFYLSNLTIIPYNRESDTFKKYTSEQPPQITFSDDIKHLADSITGDEKNPAVIVRKIYLWFKENIPWTRALEYSIMANIPEYVYNNRRGDCGMQTFLYMSMLRYKGIPVRWQSGWMIPPGAENLHDWCEVYFEGAGWIPSDVSYDLQKSDIKVISEYYLSGIDSYRLIVNDGVAGNLYPEKHFMRSEPYDFQRGEVEWNGGNLYFDKWDYNIKIDYLK